MQRGSLSLCRTLFFLQTFLGSTLVTELRVAHIHGPYLAVYELAWFLSTLCWKETYTYYYQASETFKSQRTKHSSPSLDTQSECPSNIDVKSFLPLWEFIETMKLHICCPIRHIVVFHKKTEAKAMKKLQTDEWNQEKHAVSLPGWDNMLLE